MVNYTWFKEPVPKDLKYTQVYAIAFTDDYRILLRIEHDKYQLTGGKPELNESYEDTLKREYIEEANTYLDDCHYLGYLLVEEDDKKYAQVRLIARITDIKGKEIDPATGEIYDRKLVLPENVKKYLNYPEGAGNYMLDDAIALAKEKYTFKKINGKEELV